MAGHESHGPSKLQGMKMQDIKMLIRAVRQKLCGGFCWNLQRLRRKDDN